MLALAGGTAAAGAAVGAFALGPLLTRFDTGGTPEGRFENWPTVWAAVQSYLPLGSGIGSFDPVYRSVEPLERLDPTFFNQAHNDYLELLLETGWLGGAILLMFFWWYAKRSLAAWRASSSAHRDLQRAATIAIGAALVHSAVDYPLRTATLSVIFAFCCAILELANRSASAPKPQPVQ